MKALLLLLVIVAGVWLWRSRQTGAGNTAPPAKPATPTPLDMVRCSQCGLHLPGNEAIAGQKGLYCSAEHRQQSEP